MFLIKFFLQTDIEEFTFNFFFEENLLLTRVMPI